MPRLCRIVSCACVLITTPLTAQWLNYPTKGVPRTAGGQPDMTAPAPRTAAGKPDFSGMWQVANPLPCDDVNRVCTDLPISTQFINLGSGVPGGLPYTPWANQTMVQTRGAPDPYTHCISPGGPRMHLLPTMKKIVQTPALMVILDEYNASFRQMFIDGRRLPEDPQPAWNGYSSGRWEGDTLVVESNGFRDDQWLDASRNPLTSAARVTERFRRPNYGTLEIAPFHLGPSRPTNRSGWVMRLDSRRRAISRVSFPIAAVVGATWG